MGVFKLTEHEMREIETLLEKYDEKEQKFPIVVSCKHGCQGQCDGCKGTICAKH